MRTTLLLVITIVVAACGAETGASPSPSAPDAVDANGDWSLVRGTVDGAALPMVPGADITMSVEGSQISGRSACNQYGGEIVVVNGEVRFGPLFMTEMACDEPIMASEAAYHAALGKVRAASLDGDALTLSGPGVELVYARLAPPPTAALVGTTWRLDSLITADAVSSVMGDPATLILGEDGTLTGSTGCRTFAGRYAESNGEIVFSPFAMEQTDCDPALAAQDDHVTAVLGDGFRAAIDGQRLTLTGTGGLGLGYLATE